MNPMQERVTEAEGVLTAQEKERLMKETDPARRQLLRLLYAREKKHVANLKLVSLRQEEQKAPLSWKRVLLPLLAVTVNCVSLVLWLTLPETVTPENSGWMGRYVLCIMTQLLGVALGAGTLLQVLVRKNTVTHSELSVDESAWKQYLLEAENRTALDVQTIEAVFAQEMVTSSNQYEEATAELYCALREMQADAQLDGDASQLDALSWPLSQANRLLLGMGCKAVEYAPETAGMFDVIDADVQQQRRPAIVQTESGLVRQRGLYLRQTEKR